RVRSTARAVAMDQSCARSHIMCRPFTRSHTRLAPASHSDAHAKYLGESVGSVKRSRRRPPATERPFVRACHGSIPVSVRIILVRKLLAGWEGKSGEPGGNRACWASPQGDAQLPEAHTANPDRAKRDLVSRVGIEPTTRRLRVCCSAN